jgi:stress-induced morphogen
MIDPEEVKTRLVTALPGAEVEVVDMTGTRDHYQARVVSTLFEGKSPIEQHRLVYGALGDAMQGAIHALALKTYTPAAWSKIKGES